MQVESVQSTTARWDEIREIWQRNQWLYIFAGFLAGIVFFPFIQFVIEDLSTLIRDFVPEAVGLMFTVFFIDQLYRRREQERDIQEIKNRLLRDVNSNAHDSAVRAIDEMRASGWLMTDVNLLNQARLENANLQGVNLEQVHLRQKNLKGINLSGANLHHVVFNQSNLSKANLRETYAQKAEIRHVDLSFSELNRADLREVDFTGSDLNRADMEYANLTYAILRDADLSLANLQDATLYKADLRGVNLSVANLFGADLSGAQFDETSVMPDGKLWTPETDIEQFVVPLEPHEEPLVAELNRETE